MSAETAGAVVPGEGTVADVVLVGARDGALLASAQLGLRTHLVSETPPQRARRGNLTNLCITSFEQPPEAFVELAQNALPQFSRSAPPAAVVALTERSVLPAAVLREHWGLAGNSTRCAARCRDKLLMKQHARAGHIECADFSAVNSNSDGTTLALQLGLPLVLKPRDASGSRGTQFVRCAADLPAQFSDNNVAESLVHGMEMSVESLVVDGEIRFVNQTEYLLPLWANIVPASLPAEHRAAVLALNEQVLHHFEVQRGMTHLELFLTPGGPIFGELALRPPGGQLMRLIELAYGFDPWQAMLKCELGQLPQLPSQAHQMTGVWLLHPGAGRVGAIHGVNRAQQVPGVLEATCRARLGEHLTARAGSGESVGHVIVTSSSRADVVRALEQARRQIWIDLSSQALRETAE